MEGKIPKSPREKGRQCNFCCLIQKSAHKHSWTGLFLLYFTILFGVDGQMYLFFHYFFFCYDLLLISVHLQVESVTTDCGLSYHLLQDFPPYAVQIRLPWLQSCSLVFSWNTDEPGEMLQHEHPSLNNLRCYFCGFPIDCLRKSLFNRLQRCRLLQTPRASADSINPPACGEIFKGNKGKSYLSSLWFHTERWRVPVSFCDSSVHVSCFSIRQTHDTEISSLIKATTNKAVGLSSYFIIS